MNGKRRYLSAVRLFIVLIVSLGNYSCSIFNAEKNVEKQGLDFEEIDSRERQLQSVPVGTLPSNTSYNVLTLLFHANKQIAKYGLRSCSLVFQCNPEDLLSDTLTTDVRQVSSMDELDTEVLLGWIGIKSKVLEKKHLEDMNLRQLLWFISRKYCMSIQYFRGSIVVGTGFASEHEITPGESSVKYIPDASKNQPDPFK